MKYWKWIKGRQELCNYEKFCLFSFKIWKFGFDGYILKYYPNTLLSWHKDPVKNGKHWRLNIKLKGIAFFRTKTTLDNKIIRYKSVNQRFIFFRPDLIEHSLKIFKDGCLKLSFGFVKFSKIMNNTIPITAEEFNKKYENWIEKGFKGLAFTLKKEEMQVLDNEFQKFIKRPNFKFSQIKNKFGSGRFYANEITPEEQFKIEELVSDPPEKRAKIIRITKN